MGLVTLVLVLVLVIAVKAVPGAATAQRGAGVVRVGALFAVHGAPAHAHAAARCGPVREHYGIQRVEATLLALDALNGPESLLGGAGLRLHAELRDSCWAPPTALRQTIDLVRDAIAPPHPGQPTAAATAVCTTNSASSAGGGETAAPLVGVLGPGASAAAVQVQNLLQLFSIPQVSYSATSRELSDRARFSTFFRVVPSDRHQARLLVALLRAHNWTYVHAVHTDESYGQSGMATFREEAARGGVCVAREEALRAAPAPRDVDAVLARLADGPQVCVCWCEGRTARALLGGLARRGSPPLRLVASDGWADRRDVVAGLETSAGFALTLRIRSPYLKHFDTHYHALKPYNNTRNPWFQEFWEQKFNCSLADMPPEGMRQCTGSESLATGYTQEPKLALVVRGVYALAHALRDMHAAECAGARASGLCAAMLPFNVSLYRRYLARVRFRAPDGGLVAFDDNGDPPPELSEYDVMSFEGDERRGWRYVRVARWRRGALRLRGGEAAAAGRAAGVRGTCSRACDKGEWARPGEGRARCCWTCVPCAPHAVVTSVGCRACAPGQRPDAARRSCLPVPLEWGGSRWARGATAGAASAGLAAAALCAVAFWRHRDTPVVKSASRELYQHILIIHCWTNASPKGRHEDRSRAILIQLVPATFTRPFNIHYECALLLCCAAVCHGAALAGAARPAGWPCAAVRLGAPALGGVYACVLARTVRIARLVAASERPRAALSRPRWLSARAQVGAWAALSAPGAAAAAWSALSWPAWPRVVHPARARAVLACGGEHARAQLLPLAPALLLLAACVALAVKTRRLPHNFNETRFIGAAAYTTCVTWVAFVPLYAATEARTLVLCACVSLSAGACVALSLGPRLWVCVCRPQRNTREHFLTATSIRCHLGKYRPGTSTAPMTPGAPIAAQTRDASSQTSEYEDGGECPEGEVCSAVGACARVSCAPAEEGNGTHDVIIVLLPHRHPRTHTAHSIHNTHCTH